MILLLAIKFLIMKTHDEHMMILAIFRFGETELVHIECDSAACSAQVLILNNVNMYIV